MKLSDFKNEEALDLLADILEPTAKILGDPQISLAVKSKASKIEVIKIAIKSHKSEVIEILARFAGVEVKDYSCNIVTITRDLLELLNDKELTDFFALQEAMMEGGSSSSAMANIAESAQ